MSFISNHKRGVTLLLLSALLIGFGLWLTKPGVEDRPPYLSFSADTDGLKGWRELVESRQQDTGEWKLRWEQLPKGNGQLLVAAEPTGVDPQERSALQSWLIKGNHLILLARDPESLYGFDTVPVDGHDEDRAASASEVTIADQEQAKPVAVESPLLQGRSGLTALALSPVRIKPDVEDEVLVRDDKGVLASRMKVGSGSATLVLEPEWLQNGEVLSASHLELMWPLFADKKSLVLFDEFHHGYGMKPGILAVYPDWLLLASIQLAAAFLLWLWLRGKRFGPVYIPREWTVRRGDETILALAVWYRRGGQMEEALQHGRQRLRQRLAMRWGLGPEATPAQASAAALSRWSAEDAARLERALLGLPLPAGKGKAARQEFMRRASDHAELLTKLDNGGEREK